MKSSNFGKKRRIFRWPAQARELAKSNLMVKGFQLRQLVTHLVQMTSYPRAACRRFLQRMGNKNKGRYKRWPTSEQDRLLEVLDKHSVAEAAPKMRCSKSAIYAMLRRLRIPASMRQDHISKRELAAALHVHVYVIDSWIRNDWLKATIIELGKVKRTVIKPADFVQFCQEYGKEVVGHRLTLERLEFVYKFVFPPDHNDLLAVRESKKQRTAMGDLHSTVTQHGEFERALKESDDGGSNERFVA